MKTKKVRALGEEWILVRTVGRTALLEKNGERISVLADYIDPIDDEHEEVQKEKPRRKRRAKKG